MPVAAASIHARFGRVVRARREAVGISQEDLADEAGVHRTYVSILERGRGNPSLTVIANLAEALETSISLLFKEVEAGSR